jgi:signal transduction histidine kinase
MAPTHSPRPADILIVDDTHANLQLLGGMLKERGHKVRPAPSGPVALQAALQEPPDLILLDIDMPEMNGYEVCAQLKRQDRTREIPVIFISALNETIDKVMAFGVGGVDYITKPFQFEEVDARVAAHLKLRRLQIDLGASNEELRRTNEDLRRLQQLRDNLTHMIVHDLRSPLTGVLGAFDMVEFEEKTLSASSRKLLDLGRNAGRQILGMINSLLDISKIEAGELQPRCAQCDLSAAVQEALHLLGGLEGKRAISIESPEEQVLLSFDRELIIRLVQNLVGNAVKFTDTNGTIRITIASAAGAVRVSVSDDGPGIAPEHHRRIFEKFGQVNTGESRVGTGLGLTFCKLVAEVHGGRIGVESEVGKGSTFWFELPDPHRIA